MFRLSEIVALVSLSTTFFLFIHTRDLNLRLAESAQFETSASALGQEESSLNKDRRIAAERSAELELYGKVRFIKLYIYQFSSFLDIVSRTNFSWKENLDRLYFVCNDPKIIKHCTILKLASHSCKFHSYTPS